MTNRTSDPEGPGEGPRVNRKASLRALLSVDDVASDTSPGPTARVPAGAVRAMGLSLGRLQDEAAAAQALREQMSSSASVVELDPSSVEGSFIADRMDADEEAELRDLVRSIRESGQQVPALVRPHPDAPDRYQIAYGHRRLYAVRLLGLPLKTVVRPLSDAELVIAQGQENLGRRDLSFIERALFAAHLEQRGFDRPTLNAALSVHSAEMTRYLGVVRAVPTPVVRAIGAAPKVGRTRWVELARLLKMAKAKAAAQAALSETGFSALASDARFAAVFEAVCRANSAHIGPEFWRNEHGDPVVRIEHSAGATHLTVNEKLAPNFGRYLAQQIEPLYRTFQAESAAKES